MNKYNSIILPLLICLLFVTGCITSYQKVITDNQLDYMYEQIVTIDTHYEFRFGEARTSEDKRSSIGFIHGEYIVALKHAAIPTEYIQINTPIGIMYKPIFITHTDYSCNGNKLYLIGYNKDIALFAYTEHPKKIDFSGIVPKGYEKLLQIGTKVFMIGYAHNWSNNLVIGHIAQHYTVDDNTKFRGYFNKKDAEDRLLFISAPINSGDSGSPVYVYNRITQEMQIIGIVGLRNISSNIGQLYRIDDVSISLNIIIKNYHDSLYQGKN